MEEKVVSNQCCCCRIFKRNLKWLSQSILRKHKLLSVGFKLKRTCRKLVTLETGCLETIYFCNETNKVHVALTFTSMLMELVYQAELLIYYILSKLTE